MQVAKETFTAAAEVVLSKMLNERISKVANKHSDVSQEKALSLVTLHDVKNVSAFDDNLEALASTLLGLMPELKDTMTSLYTDAINQRIKWSKPKSKPKAEF